MPPGCPPSRCRRNTASCCICSRRRCVPAACLEIGTLAGYSTINLARAVGPGGRVVTLEYEPEHADVARANLARAGVEDRVEVIVGAALDSLPRLAQRGETFDLIFIDADKENNVAYVEWAIKLGRRRLNHRGGQHRPVRTSARTGGRRPSGPRRARHAGDDGRASAPRYGGDPDGRNQGVGRLRGRARHRVEHHAVSSIRDRGDT